MSKLFQAMVVVCTGTVLSGCNAGAIALGAMAQHALAPTMIGGKLENAPPNVRVGYISWIELLQDGSVKGKLNFDLIKDKNITFDKVTQPIDAKFSLEVTPMAKVAEGTYVLFAWDDTNVNGIYEGDQGEKRAPEVYRIRGQASTRSLWTAEKFVFTDKKLAIEYANQDGGLGFTF